MTLEYIWFGILNIAAIAMQWKYVSLEVDFTKKSWLIVAGISASVLSLSILSYGHADKWFEYLKSTLPETGTVINELTAGIIFYGAAFLIVAIINFLPVIITTYREIDVKEQRKA